MDSAQLLVDQRTCLQGLEREEGRERGRKVGRGREREQGKERGSEEEREGWREGGREREREGRKYVKGRSATLRDHSLHKHGQPYTVDREMFAVKKCSPLAQVAKI